MYKYILFILIIILHGCSKCSKQEKIDGSHIEDRNLWNDLSIVGLPSIPDTIPSTILERYCYTVSYNHMKKQPNWVMWELKGEHVMKKKKGVWNKYQEDRSISADDRSTLEDYKNSGYDKGHMCPGGDCNWDDEGRDETFRLTNICPQNHNLNQGDWKEIEIACRNWAKKYGSIYIVCGPIFFKSQQHERIGFNQIPVPEAFFKVVLCTEQNQPKGIGFICRNTDGNRKKDFYVNSIRQVERVTGYSFFPNISDSIKNLVYDMDSINDW